MSIIHYAVCELCSTQTQLEDHEIESRDRMDLFSEEKYSHEKQLKPPVAFSVDLSIHPIYGWNFMKLGEGRKPLVFCGKSCFIEFLTNHLDENCQFDFEKKQREEQAKDLLQKGFLKKSSIGKQSHSLTTSPLSSLTEQLNAEIDYLNGKIK